MNEQKMIDDKYLVIVSKKNRIEEATIVEDGKQKKTKYIVVFDKS